MFFAAKHFDPQLGIDAHTYLAPPGVWPTLHIGIVMDPFDYLPTIQVSPDNPIVKGLSAMDGAMQAGLDTIGQGTAAPEVPAPPGAPAGGGEMPASIPFPLGATVEVAGVRRANAGTGGVDFHILVGAPMPVIKAPGGPQFDDELFMGSRIVLADGEPFSRISVPVLACNIVGLVPPFRKKKAVKPLRLSLMLPTTFNVAIPPQVFVGGPPTISWGAMVQRGLFKALGRAYTRVARRAFKNMPPGFLKCQVLRAEPVDIRDGSVSVTHEDFHIPGRLPLSWTRIYASRDHALPGHCGHGWQTPADVRLMVEADGLLSLQGPEEFALFPALPQAEGQQVLDVVDGARLMRRGTALVVRFKSGLRYHFEDALPPEGKLRAATLPIVRIEDACGNHWRFMRQGSDLVRIVESGVDNLPGRSIEVHSREGCIESMALRDPTTGQDHPLVRYLHADGDLLAAIDALGAAREFAYLQHRMARHTDRTGLSFHYAYDEQWRVVHAWGDGGLHDYRFAYNAALRQTEVTNSLGHLTVVKFDEAGLPLAEIDPLDGVTTFEYDDVGRTVAVTAPGGLRTGFTYDARGNLLEVQRPDGSTIGSEFDDEDRMLAVIDPLGHRWTQTYDARGLLASQCDPRGAITRFAHDAHGQLAQHVDARGALTQLQHDRHGQLRALTDPLGHESRFDYDVLGRLTEQTDVLGRVYRYHHDAKGRLLRIEHPGGGQINCTYDAEDQLVVHIDESGAQTRLQYVGTGRVSRRIQPDGQTVQYHYDTEEWLVGLTNQRGERYALRRDALDRIVEEVDFWGQSRHYQYDAAGRLTATIDPLGQRIAFANDPMGRITRKTFADPLRPDRQVQEHFAYDLCGQLVEMRNDAMHVKRRFDPAGLLLEERQGGFRVTYRYDEAGNRVLRETSAGHRTACAFDPGNRLESLTIDDRPPIVMTRDALGRTTHERLGSGLERQFDYDVRDQLTAQRLLKDVAPVFDTRYDYDRAGHLVSRSDSQQGFDQYRYDVLGQLLEHTTPQGRIQRFLHDPAGDRLQTRIRLTPLKQVAGGEADPEAVLWTREGSLEGVHYVFDRAGDLVRMGSAESVDDGLEFLWDANHRLTESRSGAVATRYGYDPAGRRVFKRGPTQTTWFFWDGNALLGEMVEDNDAPRPPQGPPSSPMLRLAGSRQPPGKQDWRHQNAREYVYYPSTFVPLALIAHDSGATRTLYYHVDPNGCPTRITDEDGRVVWSASFDAWGAITALHREEVSNPLRFQGQYFDPETRLHYNRYRYFDPNSGQFISQDPLRLRAGENLTRYAENPILGTDPLGLVSNTPIPYWEVGEPGLHGHPIIARIRGDDHMYDHYENPGHHDPDRNSPGRGDRPYNPRKSVLPDNHLELFNSSRSYPGDRSVRYALDSKGNVHQFQDSGGRTYHWAGSDNGVSLRGAISHLRIDDARRKFAKSLPPCRA
ncbi:type IV secretion protein Rhs [Variovorax beijingensis]|uniref:Type IV secretion protein Rhs n=1 Tax=Variovorax beijingensis TaxID=2496117 RepID=A0A3P3ERW2_9BURK|nr:RHS repeat-associated core domain-containing protein [Variovorax beijingensis]RRH88977.1 type IV secretion protein Rhs [Variovorax beijingensis]RSZ36281.1 type IV secretion protein Rhs [Variovorax beijingensis]